METISKMACGRLEACGLKPSVQRLMIMEYLLSHCTHPTVEDIHKALGRRMPTLSRTTVYNTLRLFAGPKAAPMITIEERRVCYDGVTKPHAHFYCRECGRVYDLDVENVPSIGGTLNIGGNLADEVQLYYKGVCAACAEKKQNIINIINKTNK